MKKMLTLMSIGLLLSIGAVRADWRDALTGNTALIVNRTDRDMFVRWANSANYEEGKKYATQPEVLPAAGGSSVGFDYANDAEELFYLIPYGLSARSSAVTTPRKHNTLQVYYTVLVDGKPVGMLERYKVDKKYKRVDIRIKEDKEPTPGNSNLNFVGSVDKGFEGQQ